MITTTREATPGDIPRLMEIRLVVRENRLHDPSRATAADYAWFVAKSEIWVWTVNDVIEGFAAADPRDGSIWALFVVPAHEGRGAGRNLLARACNTLRAAGFEAATLSTTPGTRADCFYRTNGWAETGRNAKGEIEFRRRL